MSVLNLYTFRPNFVCDDEGADCVELYIQGIVEALNDNAKDKLACFLEIKREEVLLFEKFSRDLRNGTEGSFYRNHVLLDALVMYKKYSVEFGDDSAFGRELVKLSLDLVCSLYETFSCAVDKIVIYVESDTNPEDEFNVLLRYLESCKYIQLEKVRKIGKEPRLVRFK
jgi:hypothetical protein